MFHQKPSFIPFLSGKTIQLLLFILLFGFLLLGIYLVKQRYTIKSKAAPESTLSLIPRNTARTPEGQWNLPVDSTVNVDVVLNSGANEVETVESVIFYNPAVVSLKKTGGLSTDNITCSQFSPLKYKVGVAIGGITVDQSGIEQGTETGFASVLCSAVQSSSPDAAYTPVPAGFSAPIATFAFTTKTLASQEAITFDFNPPASVNDSSIIKYEGQCCSQTNVLQAVNNLSYSVVAPNTQAVLSLSPNTGTYTQGEQFTVAVNLSTGPFAIDAADVIIEYDKSALHAVGVTEGAIFPLYTKTPSSGIDETGTKGTIDITGQINPSSQTGLQGDNLLFATITFEAIGQNVSTPVTFRFTQTGERNDTNIVQFKQGTDVLAAVINGSYQLSATAPSPTPTINLFPASLKLVPASASQIVGQTFTTDVFFSTTSPADSVDAVITYDKRYLRIAAITPSTAFENNTTATTTPADPNLNSITITGQVGASSTGVIGTDIKLATITFEPLATVTNTPVTFDFDGTGARNDSNIVKFQASTDMLGAVQNATYTIDPAPATVIEQIKFIIALQGRVTSAISKQKELAIRFLSTYFENNPISVSTNTAGEATVTSQLENRLAPKTYIILVKPKGYLQRKVETSLPDKINTVDLTNQPFKAGDFDGSGQVNSFDWAMYHSKFNGTDDLVDIDGSGQINALDNTYILLNWFGEDER